MILFLYSFSIKMSSVTPNNKPETLGIRQDVASTLTHVVQKKLENVWELMND